MTKFSRLIITLLFIWAITYNPLDKYNEYLTSDNSNLAVTTLSNNNYFLSGRIQHNDCVRVRNMLPRYSKRDTTERTIILSSPGGNFYEGLCIADYIHENRYNTVITSHPIENSDNSKVCASACAYIFIAGKDRSIIGNALLGIHNAGLPKEVLNRYTPTVIEYTTHLGAARLIESLDRYDIDSRLKLVFFKIPHSTILWLHPRKFKKNPELREVATRYIDFFGYNGEE